MLSHLNINAVFHGVFSHFTKRFFTLHVYTTVHSSRGPMPKKITPKIDNAKTITPKIDNTKTIRPKIDNNKNKEYQCRMGVGPCRV